VEAEVEVVMVGAGVATEAAEAEVVATEAAEAEVVATVEAEAIMVGPAALEAEAGEPLAEIPAVAPVIEGDIAAVIAALRRAA
jgi:hypothetical protein